MFETGKNGLYIKCSKEERKTDGDLGKGAPEEKNFFPRNLMKNNLKTRR